MRPHSGIVTRPDLCGSSALGVQTACPPGVCKVPTYIDGMCHGHWHWHCFKNSEPVCEDRTRVGNPPPPQFHHLPTVPTLSSSRNWWKTSRNLNKKYSWKNLTADFPIEVAVLYILRNMQSIEFLTRLRPGWGQIAQKICSPRGLQRSRPRVAPWRGVAGRADGDVTEVPALDECPVGR